jgi:hypothetical protein
MYRGLYVNSSVLLLFHNIKRAREDVTNINSKIVLYRVL